jgi:hypothetical protein
MGESAMTEKTKQMMQANAALLTQLKKWHRAWNVIIQEQGKERPDPAVLKQAAAQLVGWGDAFPEYRADWQGLDSRILESYQDMLRHYESDLRQACNQLGFNLEGEYPVMTVDGLIKIQVNKDRSAASVNGKKTATLSIPSIVEVTEAEHKRLWDRPFDRASHLRSLNAAYREACQHRHMPEGEYVPLRDVLQVLQTADPKYGVDLFAADLSRLMETPGLDVGLTLELAPVRDPKDAVFIYDRRSQNGRYIGLISFRKERA